MSFSHTEAWLRMLAEVQQVPEYVYPRQLASLQMTFTQHSVIDPLSFPLKVDGRSFRDVIGVLEGLSLVGEFSVPELFTDRVKKFEDFMDGGIMWGAYGSRTHGQLNDLVELIDGDLDTRQAVLTFFDAKRDLNRKKLDIPCTISAQFFVRAGDDDRSYLDLGISMRSNDLWLGTPYDLVQFSILQASVAQALGVEMGRYVHRAGSLHLYQRDEAKAREVRWEGGPSMPFPLWDIPPAEDSRIRMALIQSRARRIALGQLEPGTKFEAWAHNEVHPDDLVE
jgi:Thymidylate synthase